MTSCELYGGGKIRVVQQRDDKISHLLDAVEFAKRYDRRLLKCGQDAQHPGQRLRVVPSHGHARLLRVIQKGRISSDAAPASLRLRPGSPAYDPACPGAGATPSCCSKPNISNCAQCSASLPPATRNTSIPVTLTCLPVGGIPISSP